MGTRAVTFFFLLSQCVWYNLYAGLKRRDRVEVAITTVEALHRQEIHGMKFYNVKTRTSVDVPESACTKVIYGKGTNKQRFAFRAKWEGVQYTKFCKQADFEAATGIPEVNA